MMRDSNHIPHISQQLNPLREVVSIIVVGALCCLLFGSAIIGMSGHFGPGNGHTPLVVSQSHGGEDEQQ